MSFLKYLGAGWADVNINNRYVSSASYLDNVPTMTLNALAEYLDRAIADYNAGTPIQAYAEPMDLVFDAEGYDFGICVFNQELYIFHTDTDTYVPALLTFNDKNCESINFVVSNIAKLLQETISDVEGDFENWVDFNLSSLAWLEDEDDEEARNELEKSLNNAKRVLAEYKRITGE